MSAARALAAAVSAVIARRHDDATVAWVAAHREVLQIGGIVVAIVVLLLVDMSWPGLLLLAVVTGGYELAVARITGPTPGRGEPRP